MMALGDVIAMIAGLIFAYIHSFKKNLFRGKLEDENKAIGFRLKMVAAEVQM